MATRATTPDVAALRDRYLAAQLAGDRREALRVVVEEGLDRGVSASDISVHVVGGAQREIGRLWQENRVTVADEHQATAISQVVLANVFGHLARAARTGKRVLVACVDGELHDMAARIACDVLDAAGFDTTFLGASVPTASLCAKVASLRPDLVALSVTMTFHLGSARGAIASLRAAFPGLPLLVGGADVVTAPGDWGDGVERSDGTAYDLARRVAAALGVP